MPLAGASGEYRIAPLPGSALERGLVDGFGWATLGPADWGWLKHCKYIIDIPFYTRQNVLILMNLDVWNGLGKNLRGSPREALRILVADEVTGRVDMPREIPAQRETHCLLLTRHHSRVTCNRAHRAMRGVAAQAVVVLALRRQLR